jgi:hypothetical protein
MKIAKFKNENYERGFIGEIVVVVIALVVLKYFFHVDVVGYLSDGPLAKSLTWIGERLK